MADKEMDEFWAAEEDYWLIDQSREDGPLAVYDSTAGFVVIRQRVWHEGMMTGWTEQMVFVRPENVDDLADALQRVASTLRRRGLK